MTRLTKADIDPILERLGEYDALLERRTGASLLQLACRASGVEERVVLELQDRVRIAAVPVQTGLGLIDGFSLTVAGIVSHLGFQSFVTESSDVAGLVEGIERGADVLMLADDYRFIALTPARSHVVDNAPATAHGFVAGVELMRGGLAGATALVLGCGPVGVAAAKALLGRGAEVALSDLRRERVQAALREIGAADAHRVRTEDDVPTALPRYELIFDATDAGGFIGPDHLGPNTLVAAPGLPCALTPEAMARHRERVLHDALEIGTATMAVQAAATLAGSLEAGDAGDAGEAGEAWEAREAGDR